jgi:hypothetical protein
MADGNYPKDRTALLFVDPYNDFLSEMGPSEPLPAQVGRAPNVRER